MQSTQSPSAVAVIANGTPAPYEEKDYLDIPDTPSPIPADTVAVALKHKRRHRVDKRIGVHKRKEPRVGDKKRKDVRVGEKRRTNKKSGRSKRRQASPQ